MERSRVQELGELSPAEPHENDRLAQWMLSQESISLFASRILWIDEQRGMGALPLTGVTLHLEHMSDRHRVSGAFELPEDGRIDFAMEVAGDSLTPSWTGAAYVAARDVDLDHLGLDARQLGAEKLSGVVSGTVWSTWQNARLVEAEGTIRAQSPGVMNGGDWRGFDEVSASFKVERTPDSWTFAARDLVVATPNGSWPPSSAGARWTPPHDGRDGMVVISAEFARIEDLVALASPIGEPSGSPVANTLIEAAPRGAIEDLYVSAPLTDRIELGRARARGRFTGLRLDPRDWPVSVDAANGRFEASGQGLVTNVASGNLHMSAPRWLAHPLRGEGLTGTVAAIPSPEGIRVRFEGASLATPAGTLAAEGWVLAPRGEKEPELGIAFDLGPSKLTAVRALIAERVLPEPVSRWLEMAAPDGDIHRARLLLHGRLSELPFSAGTGKLEATAELALAGIALRPWLARDHRCVGRGAIRRSTARCARRVRAHLRLERPRGQDHHRRPERRGAGGTGCGTRRGHERQCRALPRREPVAGTVHPDDRYLRDTRRQHHRPRAHASREGKGQVDHRRGQDHTRRQPNRRPRAQSRTRGGERRDCVPRRRRRIRRYHRDLAWGADAHRHWCVSRVGEHDPPVDRRSRDTRSAGRISP